MKDGWKIQQLSELYNIQSSKRVHKADWRTEGIPFYRAREVVKLSKNGFIDNELFISEELFNEFTKDKGAPKKDDIIISAVGTLGKCYLVKENDKFYIKDASVLWFSKISDVYSRYIEYTFKSKILQEQIFYKSMGATVGTLTIGRAKNIQIPIPPLDEQIQIVAKLDKLFDVINKAKANVEKNLQNAKELFQSKLNEIFSQKGDRWVEKKLGEVAVVIAGQSPQGKYYNSIGDGLPFYQGKKLFGEKYLGEPNTWTSIITKESYEGDIVMSVRAPVGNVNFNNHKKICIGRGLAAIRAGKSINKDYLFYFLINHENEIVGNTGAVFNSINKTQIGNIVIPMVELSKQNEIVNELNELKEQTQSLESNYQQELDALDELKKSILQKAFEGEL